MTVQVEELGMPEARRNNVEFGMYETILRDPQGLDERLLDENTLPEATRKLLLLGVAGLVAYGVGVGISAELLNSPTLSWAQQLAAGPSVLWLPLAFVFAFVGALSICLPSFYFYTQLSGLDVSFRLVTAQALRAQAVTSICLLAFVPVYMALALGSVVADGNGVGMVLAVGLLFPFVLGFAGITSVYRSFVRMLGRLTITHQRCGAFVKRMVLAWGGIYSLIAPIALWRLLGSFSGGW